MAEAKALFRVMDGNNPTDRRNGLIFKLVYAGGLRISEALNLKVGDIDFEDGAIRVVGKGNKERTVWLKPVVMELLKNHAERTTPDVFLFPGETGGPLRSQSLRRYLQRYVEKAGIRKRVHPHALRHSIAVHYLMDGAPISSVQRLLGHESLATTGIYTKLADETTKKVVMETSTAIERLAEKGPLLKEEQAEYRVRSEIWGRFLEGVVG